MEKVEEIFEFWGKKCAKVCEGLTPEEMGHELDVVNWMLQNIFKGMKDAIGRSHEEETLH